MRKAQVTSTTAYTCMLASKVLKGCAHKNGCGPNAHATHKHTRSCNSTNPKKSCKQFMLLKTSCKSKNGMVCGGRPF